MSTSANYSGTEEGVKNSTFNTGGFCTSGSQLSEKELKGAKKFPTIFDNYLGEFSANLADPRTGQNTRFSIYDFIRTSFCIQYYQFPSINNFMSTIGEATRNVRFFDKNRIPSDRHIASFMDRIPSSSLNPLLDYTRDYFFSIPDIWARYLTKEGYLVVAIDGSGFTTSHKIFCSTCCEREHKDGKIDYHHDILEAAIIAQQDRKSDRALPAFPLTPEFPMRIDGNKKNETERIVNARWFTNNHDHLAQYGNKIIYIADDIYSCQPICELLLSGGANFIFTCKPGSHKFLYDIVEHSEPLHNFSITKRINTYTKEKISVKYYEDNPLKTPDNYLNPAKENKVINVNFIELTIDTLNKNGTPKLDNKSNLPISRTISFATNFKADPENPKDSILRMIEIGRSRWDIEDLFNTMKHRGYNISHVYSHGKEGNVLRSFILLNIAAYSVHLITDILNTAYVIRFRSGIGEYYNIFIVIVTGNYYEELASALDLIGEP